MGWWYWAKITSAEFVSDDLFTLDDSSTVTITGAKTDLRYYKVGLRVFQV